MDGEKEARRQGEIGSGGKKKRPVGWGEERRQGDSKRGRLDGEKEARRQREIGPGGKKKKI